MTERQRLGGCEAASGDTAYAEVEELRARLREAEEALEVIRSGEVDAVIVGGPLGQQIYSITNADRPYRLLIEQMKEGAVTLSSTGLIAYCNESFAALVGKDVGQITGSQFEQFVLSTDISFFEALFGSVSGGRIVTSLMPEGGTEIPVSLSLSPLPDTEGRRIVCAIVTDLRQLRQSTKDLADAGVRLADQIAVRERTEALLHQAQKMEVVGQLTGGLAHDFNNLLMIIGGNLDLIRRQVTDDKTVQRLNQVLGAVQRGGKLTQQLLAFSRTQSLSPQSICINNLVTEIEMLVRRALSSTIDLRLDLATDLWFCRADPNQLESALLNLAINARDAMPDGGRVYITTRNASFDVDAAEELGEIAPGRYTSVTVSDTGAGMPADILARVFEPFFTTKEVGKGSGLGLSQVYGFARQSGGHISIESTLGEGTAVCLYLPWTERLGAPASEEAPKTPSTVKATRTILIVEDNDELRELATQLVEALGYSTCSASTGAEALSILAKNPKIGILFTDVLMPGGMNGFELAAETRRSRPEIAILLTSGFPGNLLAVAQQNGDFEMIAKPFTQADLAAALEKVAGERRAVS